MKTKTRQRLVITAASGPDFGKRMGFDNLLRRLEVEDRFDGRRPGLRRKLIRWGKARFFRYSIHLFLALMGLRSRAKEEQAALRLEINPVRVKGRRSGAAETLRILQISDPHIDASPAMAFLAADRIKTLNPDFAVITGDYFNGYRIPDGKKHELLDPILECLNCPVFGILGNHDSLSSVPHLEKRGVRMLLNESSVYESFGLKVLISGVDDPHLFRSHDLSNALGQLGGQMDRYHLRILLSHAPSLYEQAERAGFDLMLSGHTHGGQFCLRNGRPVVSIGGYPRFVLSGAWAWNGMSGYTSRGLGTAAPVLRLNCPPEITLHEVTFAE